VEGLSPVEGPHKGSSEACYPDGEPEYPESNEELCIHDDDYIYI
jgi:hypothetical protein